MRVLIALDWSGRPLQPFEKPHISTICTTSRWCMGSIWGCFNIRSSRKSAACKGMTTSATP